METPNSNLGLNLPSNPPPSAQPFNQFSPYLPPPKPTEIAEPTVWERFNEFVSSKKIVETSLWLVLLVLFVPSGMAVASWNAVPGDMTYSWKTGLEKALLVVLKPSKTLQTSTQVALTQRRFDEASKLLKENQGKVGLKNLSDQVQTTSNSIQSLSAGSSKTQFTIQYIEALTELNQKLEQEKKQHQGSSYRPGTTAARKPGTTQPVVNYGTVGQGGAQPAGTTIIQNTYVQNTIVQNTPVTAPNTVNAPTAAPQPAAPVDAVTSEIIETQEQIQDTIAELQIQTQVEPVIQPTSVPAPEPTTAPPPTNVPVQQGIEPQSNPQGDQPQSRGGDRGKNDNDSNQNPNQDSNNNSQPNQGSDN